MGLSCVFQAFDKDKSKRLNFEEFSDGMAAFGINVSPSDMKRLFDHFDSDHSSVVDFNEFLKVLKPPLNDFRKKLLLYVFDLLDKDQNGILTTDDIAQNRKYQELLNSLDADKLQLRYQHYKPALLGIEHFPST